MAPWQLPAELVLWLTHRSQPLHARVAGRWLPWLAGLVFAQGRRTVASWLRAGALGDDDRASDYFLGSLGRQVQYRAGRLLRRAGTVIVPEERLRFGLADTPTPR